MSPRWPYDELDDATLARLRPARVPEWWRDRETRAPHGCLGSLIASIAFWALLIVALSSLLQTCS